MTDRELLEAAAKAAGLELLWPHDPSTYAPVDGVSPRRTDTWSNWNPLTDDGDALRLAVRCTHLFGWRNYMKRWLLAMINQTGSVADYCLATRRAIVSAAAAIGGAR